MNIWKLIILFVFVSAGAFSFKAEARKPAVEPVMGLSIEEYDHAPPSEAKGFNFEQESETTSQDSSTKLETSAAPINIAPRMQEQETSSESPSTFFYLLISLMPFIIWFGVMKNLDQDEVEEGHAADNMYDLESQRQKKAQEEKDDHDIPKAS